MNDHDQRLFWDLYNRDARPVIERACRAMSRTRTDGGMDDCDMIAWVDDRVWRMLETGAWPAFHDEPGPEEAVQRLASAASLLARWSYLALCRRYWRQISKCRVESDGVDSKRIEVLAQAKSDGQRVEISEGVEESLDRIRGAVSERMRLRLAASWPERSERHRIALALGVGESDSLIDQSVDGEIRSNTIQKMRSRARRQIREMLQGAVCVLVIAFAAQSTEASGEQTGGRRGRVVMIEPAVAIEQQAGLDGAALSLLVGRSGGGEQSGGRGG